MCAASRPDESKTKISITDTSAMEKRRKECSARMAIVCFYVSEPIDL